MLNRNNVPVNLRSVNRENQNPRHRPGEREQAAGITENTDTGTNRRTPQIPRTTFRGELSLQNTKCFNCHKKGHIAKDCPVPKSRSPPSRRVAIDSSTGPEQDDLWVQRVTSKTKEPMNTHLATRGLTYKVDDVVGEDQSTLGPWNTSFLSPLAVTSSY